MTAQQAFNYAMNTYPSLYTSQNLDKARLKYYDHIFNTIGNGYRDMQEFYDGHTITPENSHLLDSFPSYFIGNEPLFYAYTKIRDHGSYKMGDSEGLLDGVYTKQQLASMPEVLMTVQCNSLRAGDADSISFYPNFQKEYSMMWDDISELDISWTQEALFFYNSAKNFFTGPNNHLYSSACPRLSDKKGWEFKIKEYEESFNKYKKPDQTQEDFYFEITKAYNTVYNGDTKFFIALRWKNELDRILSFIDETIERLQEDLNIKESNNSKLSTVSFKV